MPRTRAGYSQSLPPRLPLVVPGALHNRKSPGRGSGGLMTAMTPSDARGGWVPWREEAVMKNLLKRFVREDEGQDLIEYALLAALIAVVAAATLGTLGTNIDQKFQEVNTKLGSGGGS